MKAHAHLRRPLKYRNKPQVIDGHRFDSKAEAAYYQLLKLDPRVNHIDVHPIATLGFGDRVRIDFLVWYSGADGIEAEFVDVKGPRKTKSASEFRRMQKRWDHPIQLRAVCMDRRGRFGEWV